MLNSFWWGHSGNNGHGIHWFSWERLSVSKDHGGMGFKSLKAFNIAMLDITQVTFGGVFGAQNPSSKVAASGVLRPGDINKVKDIIMSNCKSWDIDKISSMFDSTTVRRIINTPLFASVRTDKLVWNLEHDGVYSVRSAYNYYVNNVGNQDNSGIAGNWHQIWRAKIPPKVKNLLWRIGRNVLPTRATLNSRSVQCLVHCAVCNDSAEDSIHILFLCPRSTECWQQAGLWNQIDAGLNTSNNIADILLFILQSLNKEQQEIFSVLLWSIWKRRNAKVWDNITESNTNVYERAQHLLTSWKQAQQTRSYANTPQPIQQRTNWEKPSQGRYKCNIDASFSSTHNKVGIGMCIRDDQGRYVAAKTEWLEPILDVEIGEAMGLFSAVKWVDELRLSDVDFEMDCKRVVDCLHSSRTYNSDLGDILRDCRVILATNLVNSHVKFIRRQANEVAHRLAREATCLASFHIFIDIPTCIYDIIMNEMR
ncbi:hypothetical protein TSUD_340140 [Trifolium subterraneum]|uniref:RNase H type-1 domain-containing protein n=1 Tax=Trifolium subterraneum TaxID=3900 RepID=A0A2Z6LYR7_TRISU|nr:hypothetical protein TSUD_340140 [Trifolium subterraneum]